jgi:hypothetical protein
MKKIITAITIAISSFTASAQKIQAFDATLNLNMSVRTQQNSGMVIQAGANGRRIPLSLLIGASYLEFQNYSKYQDRSKVGLNAMLMLRMYHIDFRAMDFNLYSTAHKFGNDYFLEYGGKAGILINDRSRIYVSLGEMKGKGYTSVIAGVHFSLFFFNGYNAF